MNQLPQSINSILAMEIRDHLQQTTDRSELENGLGPVLKTLKDEILELMAKGSGRVIAIAKMDFMVKDV